MNIRKPIDYSALFFELDKLIPAFYNLLCVLSDFLLNNTNQGLFMALFGMTAKEWRDAHPDLKGNIRDYATGSRGISTAPFRKGPANITRTATSSANGAGTRPARPTALSTATMSTEAL